jgi:hypothetical protein
MRRPSDSGGPPHPRQNGCFVLPSGTLKPSASANQAYLEAVPAQKASALSSTAYRILCLRFACLVRLSFGSATDARLDTGGWLALTRQGLSPGKHRQAFLGAITSAFSGAALFAGSAARHCYVRLFQRRGFRLPCITATTTTSASSTR